jgi:hypothetical protein
MIETIRKIINKDKPNIDEKFLFLSELFRVKNVENFADHDLDIMFEYVKAHIYSFLDKFKRISIPELGFFEFILDDVLLYFIDEKQFSFAFKKVKGKGILYGLEHANLRQSLVNGLPHELKVSVLISKLLYYKILSKLLCLLEEDQLCYLLDKSEIERASSIITDVSDIGMGHSVYMVTLKVGEDEYRKFVVKKEELPNQAFYCRLLSRLGWASFRSMHFEGGKDSWEITEYLGNQVLKDVINNKDIHELEKIEDQLAAHAALGDVLGRGDRHFENYLIHKDNLYPVDISILFWPDNERWIKKYLSGGMCEFSVLAKYGDNEIVFQGKEKKFFDVYEKTMESLKLNLDVIVEEIIAFYGKNQPDTHKKIAFIKARLNNLEEYVASQKTLYKEGFQEMRNRRGYKKALMQLVEQDMSVINEAPLLKMYYLADKDRDSSFFLIEDCSKDIFADLDIRQQVFSDTD